MISRLKMVACATAAFLGFAAPASAQSYTLLATLSGASQATQITNGINTGAFGDATVIVDMGTRTVTYSVRVFNLPSGVTASHIRCRRAVHGRTGCRQFRASNDGLERLRLQRRGQGHRVPSTAGSGDSEPR